METHAMAKCRVTKGGWFWKGVERVAGEVIEEGAEWIAHRVRDGLVELLEGSDTPPPPPPSTETSTRPAAEQATRPRKRK